MSLIEEKKMCLDCRHLKLISEFSNRSGKESKWKKPYCKTCSSIRFIKWREANKEKFNEYQKNYQLKRYHLKKNKHETI